MLGDISNSGSGPALEAAMRFATQRQRVIANNIANATTPNFIQTDLSVSGFQAMLRQAVDERRAAGGLGGLNLSGTDEIELDGNGGFTATPREVRGGVLFHDRNNRDLDLLMKDQVENATMYRVCADLLRNRAQLMLAALSERV